MLQEFLQNIRDKAIHIVGVTGAEGSSILRFLLKHHIRDITAHDFLKENTIEKSYKLWHKGITVAEKNKYFQDFIVDLKQVKFNQGDSYLKDVLKADIIFVPQSWRLYEENSLLWQAAENKIPFYSLTRLYLELSEAQLIGVTGTVGKGSVANILLQILKKNLPAERKVYFSGNETWMLQLGDKLDEMKKDDILILEISHRQLLDGFNKAPHIVVFTNLYPNHLDELSWEKYKQAKFNLLLSQKSSDFAVINYDIEELKAIVPQLKSKVLFFSSKNKDMNIKSVQEIYQFFLNNKSIHYLDNILASGTVANLLGVENKRIIECLKIIKSLPARLEYIASISGIEFYDDIKSTTPWATIAAVTKLLPNVILICGGRTKGINYQDFADKLKDKVKHLIIIKSELNQELSKVLPADLYTVADDLKSAIKHAFATAKAGDKIVVSPSAAFFYSDFIKGKKSLRKLIISLLPKEKS